MKKLRFLPCLFWSLAGLFVVSCTAPPPPAATRRTAARESFAAAQQERPGLGTRWGERRESHVTVTGFQRADATGPLGVAAIYYNDAPGIRAMAGSVLPERRWPALPGAAGALVSVGLRDQNGRFLPGLIVGDRWFVVGEEGERYSISIRNRSDLRLEVVLSVDGLDVLDGRAASFRKRGYILRPHGQINVSGFRQSLEAVAAFRFSSVRESYANQKYGETQNVGVIGIGVFNEYGTVPWIDREARRRLKANPFPDQFATPP